MSVIVYPNESNGLAFCFPAPDCGISVQEIARKDVPAGTPFLIVPDEDIPTDPILCDAYTADFSTPDGYGIGSEAWFAEQESQ